MRGAISAEYTLTRVVLCYIDCFPIQVENVAAGNIFPEIAPGDHDRVKSSWAGSVHVESPCIVWTGRVFLAAAHSTCVMIGGRLFYLKALFAFIAFVFECTTKLYEI